MAEDQASYSLRIPNQLVKPGLDDSNQLDARYGHQKDASQCSANFLKPLWQQLHADPYQSPPGNDEQAAENYKFHDRQGCDRQQSPEQQPKEERNNQIASHW